MAKIIHLVKKRLVIVNSARTNFCAKVMNLIATVMNSIAYGIAKEMNSIAKVINSIAKICMNTTLFMSK